MVDVVVEVCVTPFMVTDQDAPPGSPVSKNVIEYVANPMGIVTLVPCTVTVPELGSGGYPASDEATV